RYAPAGPGLEERACNMISGHELGHAPADRGHLPRPLRRRDQRKWRVAIEAAQHALVAIVQRARAHAHDDFAVARLGLRAVVVEHEAVDAGRGPDFVGFHAAPFSMISATVRSAWRKLSNMASPSALLLRSIAKPRAPGSRGGCAPPIGFAFLSTPEMWAARLP